MVADQVEEFVYLEAAGHNLEAAGNHLEAAGNHLDAAGHLEAAEHLEGGGLDEYTQEIGDARLYRIYIITDILSYW